MTICASSRSMESRWRRRCRRPECIPSATAGQVDKPLKGVSIATSTGSAIAPGGLRANAFRNDPTQPIASLRRFASPIKLNAAIRKNSTPVDSQPNAGGMAAFDASACRRGSSPVSASKKKIHNRAFFVRLPRRRAFGLCPLPWEGKPAPPRARPWR